MKSTTSDYQWNDLDPNIVGSYVVSGTFGFVIYSDSAPSKNDKILIDGNTFVVDSVTDCTDDDEREQGVSYSKVFISSI